MPRKAALTQNPPTSSRVPRPPTFGTNWLQMGVPSGFIFHLNDSQNHSAKCLSFIIKHKNQDQPNEESYRETSGSFPNMKLLCPQGESPSQHINVHHQPESWTKHHCTEFLLEFHYRGMIDSIIGDGIELNRHFSSLPQRSGWYHKTQSSKPLITQSVSLGWPVPILTPLVSKNYLEEPRKSSH